jgi:hypothetical protein
MPFKRAITKVLEHTRSSPPLVVFIGLHSAVPSTTPGLEKLEGGGECPLPSLAHTAAPHPEERAMCASRRVRLDGRRVANDRALRGKIHLSRGSGERRPSERFKLLSDFLTLGFAARLKLVPDRDTRVG